MEDLKDFNSRIKQMCEPYTIQSSNVIITVYFDKNNRERYSSFDRFSVIDSSLTTAIDAIHFEYNLLIISEQTRRPQNCKLTVHLISRVSTLEKVKEDDLSFNFHKIFGPSVHTVIATVEFVDYVIARNLMHGIDLWVKSVDVNKFPKWFKFIRRKSDLIRTAVMYLMGGFATYLVARAIPNFVPQIQPDYQILAYFYLLGTLSIFVFLRIGRFAGRMIEDALDTSWELSYIKINRGDERLICAAKKQKLLNWIRGCAGVVVSISVSLAANIIWQFIA